MFGMLDYRANKLFTLLFGLPLLLLRWAYTFGAPFLYYFIGLAMSNNRIFQILISILALFIFEIVWALLFAQINKFLMFVFNLIVDVIPADGRTSEEAKTIVVGGSQVLFLWEFNKKSPHDWTDDDISIFSGGFFKFFFKDKIEERIRRIRRHYIDNPELTPSEWNTKKYLESSGLKSSIFEDIVTNPILRAWTTSAVIFILLMIFG